MIEGLLMLSADVLMMSVALMLVIRSVWLMLRSVFGLPMWLFQVLRGPR